MDNSKEIYLEKKGEIATIFFNRPGKRNALTYEMWKTIPQLLQEVENDSTVKVLIVRGMDQTAFAAGADISEFTTLRSTAEGAKVYNEATHHAERSLANFKKPTIAMVQGYCIGGGCELAVACDFRFSDLSGRFGITPAKLGLVYSLEATKQLVDLVGPQNAKYILYTGKHLNVEHAQRMGLVDEIFAAEEIEQKTFEFAQTICANAQYTVRSMKYFISEVLRGTLEDTEATSAIQLHSYETEDYKEGVRAFMEKRKPRFTFS